MLSKIIATSCAMSILPVGAALAAAAGGGGGLPWDAPLTTIQTDLSGPVATSISLIALVTVFGVLIFGGELNHFARTLCFIVMAAATLVGGAGIFGALGIAGATIDGSSTFIYESGIQIIATVVAGAAAYCWASPWSCSETEPSVST